QFQTRSSRPSSSSHRLSVHAPYRSTTDQSAAHHHPLPAPTTSPTSRSPPREPAISGDFCRQVTRLLSRGSSSEQATMSPAALSAIPSSPVRPSSDFCTGPDPSGQNHPDSTPTPQIRDSRPINRAHSLDRVHPSTTGSCPSHFDFFDFRFDPSRDRSEHNACISTYPEPILMFHTLVPLSPYHWGKATECMPVHRVRSSRAPALCPTPMRPSILPVNAPIPLAAAQARPCVSGRGTIQSCTSQYNKATNVRRLCFRCKQPYSPMHDCPQKSLRALIAAEDEIIDIISDFGLEESQQHQAETSEAQLHFLDLPLMAIGGIDGPRTMKFSGHVYGELVTIMVDSGASHNFISTKLAQKIPQPMEQTVRFGVRLGDGSRATLTGKYSNLPIQLQSITMSLDCYIFPLGGIDIILGVAWLQTLGDIKANWTKMSIEFLRDNEEICLLGDPLLSRAPISLSSLQQMDDDIDYCLLLWQITSSTET
ncbi:Unknown protein, partial [Striga hermonthica]